MICVFDVNETLLDLRALDPLFSRVFGDVGARRAWFGQMLQIALVSTVTNRYVDFVEAQRAALQMLGQQRGVLIDESAEQTVVEAMRSLPPHSDVEPCLSRLAGAGVRMVTLTNSPPDVAEDQIRNAGLWKYFEALMSAHEVRRLKPSREPYDMVVRKLGVSADDIRLVAAHAWDVTGAMRAGWRAAFVARPGMVLDPSGETPDIVASDLLDLAEQILR